MQQLELFTLYASAGIAFEFSAGNWIVRLNDGTQYYAGSRDASMNLLEFYGAKP